MMFGRASGNFLRGVVTNYPVGSLHCCSKYDGNNIPGKLFPSRKFSVTNYCAADAPKDTYKVCPLCPTKGFAYNPEAKATLKCQSTPAKKEEAAKPKEPEKTAAEKKEPEKKEPEKKASDKPKDDISCPQKECPKPVKKKAPPKEMKPKVKTATDSPPEKPKEAKKKPKKCTDKKEEEEEEEICSVLPWPLNLFQKQKKKKPPAKSKKKTKSAPSGKKKMVKVLDELSVPSLIVTLNRSLACSSTAQLSNLVRNFHWSSTNGFGQPVCPPLKERPCDSFELSKETEEAMVKLRAVARANRRIQPTSCLLIKKNPSHSLQPPTGWDPRSASSLMRDPEVIKKAGPKKNREQPRLVSRKLRK